MSVLLVLAKVGGLVWATIFGVLGLLTEFRDRETKQTTRWGRIALLGILLSGAVSLAAHGVEYAISKEAQRKELDRLAADLARQEKILTSVHQAISQIERQNSSIQGMHVSITFRLPDSHPLVKAHLARAESVYARLREELKKWGSAYHRDVFVDRDDSASAPTVKSFWMEKPSPLFPDKLRSMLGVGLFPRGTDAKSVHVFDKATVDLAFGLHTASAASGRFSYFPSQRESVLSLSWDVVRFGASPRVLSLKDFQDRLLVVSVLKGLQEEATEQLLIESMSFTTQSGVTLDVPLKGSQEADRFFPNATFSSAVRVPW